MGGAAAVGGAGCAGRGQKRLLLSESTQWATESRDTAWATSSQSQ